MSLRKIGSFAAGVTRGFAGGEGGIQAGAAIAKDQRDAAKYAEAVQLFEDFRNGRGRWAPQGDQNQSPPPKLAPVSTSVNASPRPDAYGPPESFGGGSAEQLTRRSLDQTQQAASPLATSMAQPPADSAVAPLTPAIARRRLPFADFIGS